MVNVVYLILVLATGFISIASGFRKGFTRQLASVLGFAFGAVASRILTPDYTSYFTWTSKFSQSPEFADFTANLTCAVCIYIIVFCFFSLFSVIFNKIFANFYKGMFNRLAGAFFSLLKNLLWLSIFFNLLLCFFKSSGLLNFEKSNDGNVVASVMSLTSTVLGCYGAEDFAHFNQLKDAKKISCNFRLEDEKNDIGKITYDKS